jgi:hypothetical protein
VLITKDGRLPWIPVTLADKLDAEGEKRERALAEWKANLADMKMPDTAPRRPAYGTRATAARRLSAADGVTRAAACGVSKQYRASQSPGGAPLGGGVGRSDGEGKKKLEARLNELRALTPAKSRQQSRSREARAIRQAHMERAGPLITEAMANYDLTNLQAGPAERAIGVKPDPAFPDFKDPNRIQMIAVLFSADPDPKNVDRRAWQQRIKDTFDYAAWLAN